MTEHVLDLNADLGEGAPGDAALLQLVTSASIACGGHAGDGETMARTAAAAAAADVVIGAHPGHPDRDGFGRIPLPIDPAGLRTLLGQQVGALRTSSSAEVRYCKPHGALYHQLASDPELASVAAGFCASVGLALLGPPGSALARAASRARVPFAAEAFADRAYVTGRDGRPELAPRSQEGAVLDAPAAAAQAALLATERRVVTLEGASLAIDARSICLHGDDAEAVVRARAVRDALQAAPVRLAPFA